MHPKNLLRTRLWGALALSVSLAGCATMQSHDKLATEVQASSRAEGIPAAQ